jgi:AraC-like DNA-binding protein
MSRSPFAARFTALVGKTPMSYIKHWRLQLAAKLLQNKTLALATIAEQVGYESMPAFSRVFKREFGMAPGQYRHNRTNRERTSTTNVHKTITNNSRSRPRKARQTKAGSPPAD